MTVLRTTISDLVERKLWPVALLLVVALVAVPVVLGRGGEPAAPAVSDPVVGGGTQPEAGSSTAKVELDTSAPVLRGDDEDGRDPFKRPASAAAKTTAATTASVAPPVAPTTVPADTGTTSGASAGTGATGGSSAGGSSTGASSSGSTGSAGRARAKATHHITLRFGTTGDQRTIRDIARLSPLPSVTDPFFVFLGVLEDGKTAVFLVSSDATPTGDGRCRPSAKRCDTIELKAGDTEFFDFTAPDGTVTQYQMDLVSVRKERATSTEAVRAAYARHSRVGAELLRDAAVKASPAAAGARSYRYVPGRGVLVRAKKRRRAASPAAAGTVAPGPSEALALLPARRQPGVAVWHSAHRTAER